MTHFADRLETLPGYPLAELPGIVLVVGADRLREAVMRLGRVLDRSVRVPLEATR